MANIYEPEWDEPRDHDGFRARRARLGYELGTERVGASLWEIPPGESSYPYHYHLVEEELVVVLEGTPLLRTPDGWRRLARGELVRFPVGAEGAHQLHNDTDEPVRFLALSSHGEPDIVLYPDEGKVGAAERRPDGSGFKLFFHAGDARDYWDGVTPPEVPDVDPA